MRRRARAIPRQVLTALLAWLDRFPPVAKPATLEAFASASNDPALVAELTRLKAALYAAPGNATAHVPFSARRLRREIGAARRRLRRGPSGHRAETLPPLNPDHAAPPRPSGNRPPAR